VGRGSGRALIFLFEATANLRIKGQKVRARQEPRPTRIEETLKAGSLEFDKMPYRVACSFRPGELHRFGQPQKTKRLTRI